MMKPSVTILAICSSAKRNGHTERLLQKFTKAAKGYGARIKRIELHESNVKPVSGRLGIKLKKPTPLQRALLEADGIVIATPTYWFSEPGILKNFIDNLTIFEESGFLLEGKVGGFIVYSPQGGETDVLKSLAMTFNHMGFVIPPYGLIFYRGPQDKWAIRDLKLLAKNMIQQIRVQKERKMSWDYD